MFVGYNSEWTRVFCSREQGANHLITILRNLNSRVSVKPDNIPLTWAN